MFNPLIVPRGVANIFAVGNALPISIPEIFSHRPDKILDSINQSSFKHEIINNYISNASPISLNSRDVYQVTNIVFKNNFGVI